jgi:hypothetical protein
MMTKTLIILTLTVNVLGVAENSFAADTDLSAASHGGKATEIKAVAESGATGNLDGYISGQFLPGIKTDFVKGVSSSVRSASSVVWNGFITGTAALAPRETLDVAILLITESKGKTAWDGYVAGSFGYWQRRS